LVAAIVVGLIGTVFASKKQPDTDTAVLSNPAKTLSFIIASLFTA